MCYRSRFGLPQILFFQWLTSFYYEVLWSCACKGVLLSAFAMWLDFTNPCFRRGKNNFWFGQNLEDPAHYLQGPFSSCVTGVHAQTPQVIVQSAHLFIPWVLWWWKSFPWWTDSDIQFRFPCCYVKVVGQLAGPREPWGWWIHKGPGLSQMGGWLDLCVISSN